MALEQDLMKIENEIWNGGPEAYRAHLDDTCLVAFADRADKMPKEKIAGMAEKGRWIDVKLDKKGLVQLSDESAVLTYEATAGRKDGQPYHAYVSSGYVKRGKEWKMAFHQQTPVTQH